jgi:NADP-dependent 3-hydroxy acid dehydrogenase YdfG
MTERTLRNKNVLIAGGGKNLGGLIARQSAEAGANVAIHYNSESSRPDAEATLAAVEDQGVNGVLLSGDLTRAAAVEQLFTDAEAALGPIDIAVNTAGKVLRKPIVDTSEAEYDSMFDINSKAAYFFIKEAGRHLSDSGKIITIVTALLAAFTDGYSTYAGGKSPVEHFTPRSGKGIRRARYLGHRHRTRADGYTVLLRPGDPGARGVPQIAGAGQPAHSDRGHRTDRPLPRHRRVVDHRTDDLRQRRIHHPLRSLGCKTRKPHGHPDTQVPHPTQKNRSQRDRTADTDDDRDLHRSRQLP